MTRLARPRQWLLAAACLVLAAAAPAADPHQVTHVSVIALHPGINTIPKFSPDGREAIVAQGWRENGNANGYNLLLVMLRGSGGQVLVVPVERPDSQSDVITDRPHTGDDAVRSVRLARASVDGAPATLLLTATREIDAGGSLADASIVRFDVFRLVHDADAVGGSPDSFRLLQQSRSSAKFCSAEVALASKFGTSPGQRTTDGCS